MNAQKVRTILTLVACAGVGATAAVAAYDAKHDDPCVPKWKCYWRTAVVGGVTVACIGGSHKVGTKQIAVMAGAAASAKKLYDRYEDKVKEVIGEAKNHELKTEIAKDMAKESLSKMPEMPGEEKVEYFYEWYTDQWFYCTREGVLSALSDLNKELVLNPEEFEDEANERVVDGVLVSKWIKLLMKHGAKGLHECPEYDKPKIGWFWGDGDGWWNYQWGFFDGPWVTINFEEIFEGDDKYTLLDYGQMPPTYMNADGAIEPYKKELADAKMRWENQYA